MKMFKLKQKLLLFVIFGMIFVIYLTDAKTSKFQV